jgi:hypothetical protein
MLLMAIGMGSASATIRIDGDPGGRIEDYLAKYQNLRKSGEQVVIDGVCSSACTMVLGAVPRNRICVTSRARLGFHSAWYPTSWGSTVPSPDGNRMLWSTYPREVRHWITQHGGLKRQMIYLSGSELAAMYPACI